jgi:O-acetyl-ADP-ribose deacetylase (regulator of RNase III)
MINYLTGDATEPKVDGNKIIAHICNDVGGWGRGFVLSLTQRYPAAEAAYRNWAQGNPNPNPNIPDVVFRLGEVQIVRVTSDILVANMIAQHGITTKNEIPPIRYEALGVCLNSVATISKKIGASIHMPRIGCGLAGGKWKYIEPILEQYLKDIPTYVYDFNTGDARTIPWNQ